VSQDKKPPKKEFQLNLDAFRVKAHELKLPNGPLLRAFDLSSSATSALFKRLESFGADEHISFGLALVDEAVRSGDSDVPLIDATLEGSPQLAEEVVSNFSEEDWNRIASEYLKINPHSRLIKAFGSKAERVECEPSLEYLHRLVRMDKEHQRIQREEILNRALSPTRSLARLLAEEQKALKHTSGFEHSMFLPDFTNFLAPIEQLRNALRAAEPLGAVMREMSESKYGVVRSFESMDRNILRMAEKLGRDTHLASAAIESINKSLAPTEALLRIRDLPGPTVDLMLCPHVAFEDFVSQLLGAANRADSEIYRVNVLGAVNSASKLLNEMVEISALAAFNIPDMSAALSLPDPNVFQILRMELDERGLEDEEFEADDAVRNSLAGQLVDLAQKLVNLVSDLNLDRERNGRQPVFKPTTEGLRAVMVLCTVVATDPDSFGKIVDSLYFLLYEGSAAAERLTDVLADEELGPVWDLKQLRLGLRHDINHGSAKAINNKAKKIGDAYKQLIGRAVPRNRAEWGNAQLELYRSLVGVLGKLWE
jgi:hypothetical protein